MTFSHNTTNIHYAINICIIDIYVLHKIQENKNNAKIFEYQFLKVIFVTGIIYKQIWSPNLQSRNTTM